MKIFLSAVSAQFKACRDALASDLRAIGCEVRVQEDFQQGPCTLIERLEEYITECDRVIALVGDAYGVEASGMAVPAVSPPRSYTQWEYFFTLGDRLDGAHMPRKDLYLYLASDRFLREHPVQQPTEHAKRQHQFRGHVESTGEHCVEFDNLDQLCRLVLRDGWQVTGRAGRTASYFGELANRHSRRGLSVLSGDMTSGKKYVAELYQRRVEAEELCRDFLRGNDSLLGIYGDAGMGKTNLAVNLLEYCLKRQLACFLLLGSHLRTGDLRAGLVDALNMAAERTASWPEWQPELARAFGGRSKPLVVIIDGVNETSSQAPLRSSMIDLLAALKTARVNFRLIITCRTASWRWWVESGGGDALRTLVVPTGGAGALPGYRLGPFTYGERNRAWRRYARRFGLPLTVPLTLNRLCEHPIMLRFIAELGRKNFEQLRRESSPEPLNVVAKFLELAEVNTGEEKAARLVLARIAVALFDRRAQELEYGDIRRAIGDSAAHMLDSLVSESVLIYRRSEDRDLIGSTPTLFSSALSRELWRQKALSSGH